MAEEQQASGEATQNIVVRCTKCGETFPPDLKLKKDPWFCPHCKAKNPNLRRHFRSVADFCILGLVGTLGVLVRRFSQTKTVSAESIVHIVWALLLLVSIIRIYRAQAPWLDRPAKVLIWVTFALIIFDRIVAIFVLPGPQVLALLVVLVAVLIYVIWLFRATSQCTVAEGS